MTFQLLSVGTTETDTPVAVLHDGSVQLYLGDPARDPYLVINHPAYLDALAVEVARAQAAWAIQRDEPVPYEPTLTAVPSIVCMEPDTCTREHVGGMGGTPVHLPPDGIVRPDHFDTPAPTSGAS